MCNCQYSFEKDGKEKGIDIIVHLKRMVEDKREKGKGRGETHITKDARIISARYNLVAT